MTVALNRTNIMNICIYYTLSVWWKHVVVVVCVMLSVVQVLKNKQVKTNSRAKSNKQNLTKTKTKSNEFCNKIRIKYVMQRKTTTLRHPTAKFRGVHQAASLLLTGPGPV